MRDRKRKVCRQGHDLIRDPLLNKGAAFTAEERRAFGLEGLLPHRPVDIDLQRRRVLENLDRLADPLEKYVSLAALQDRNEHLFFNVLTHRLAELMPIVYTPTVGLATQRYSHVFQRGRGVWITPDMRGRVAGVLERAAAGRAIRLMVVTDNESILGIGDQGAGGIAISIGKLSLYTAAAGIDPRHVLPVSIDVGTENQSLLDDPMYLGWPQRRLRGQPYLDLLDEFVDAVRVTFPGALVQWEDLRKDNALRILDRYRERLPSFNDDIQGTGAVALAGLLSSERVTGRRLADERVVVHGGGAAGLGVARQIRAAMRDAGGSPGDVAPAVAVLDSRGLIVDEGGMDGYKRELAWPAELAARLGLPAGRRSLADVVRQVRPTVLIGTSGQAGAFTQEVLRAMASVEERPVVMPMSNPNAQCEAQPQDIYRWTEGRALVATGSPFPDVTWDGRRYEVGQSNNAYIFPGVGLGALAGGLAVIDDGMFLTAARVLAAAVTQRELDAGSLFPALGRMQEVASTIAVKMIRRHGTGSVREEAAERVAESIWKPEYVPYEPAAE